MSGSMPNMQPPDEDLRTAGPSAAICDAAEDVEPAPGPSACVSWTFLVSLEADRALLRQ